MLTGPRTSPLLTRENEAQDPGQATQPESDLGTLLRLSIPGPHSPPGAFPPHLSGPCLVTQTRLVQGLMMT